MPLEQLCEEIKEEGDAFEHMWKIVMRCVPASLWNPSLKNLTRFPDYKQVKARPFSILHRVESSNSHLNRSYHAALAREDRKQNGTCIDSKFDDGPRSSLATLSVDSWGIAGNSGSRQWFWMTCNEFGYFQVGLLC